jgi:peptide/nickel transport system substrate-binding protein
MFCIPVVILKNVARFNDSEYNFLIFKGIFTPEGTGHNAIYTQVEKLVAQQAPWLPISHADALCAYQPNIHGFFYPVTGTTPFADVTKN